MTHRCLLALCLASFPLLATAAEGATALAEGPTTAVALAQPAADSAPATVAADGAAAADSGAVEDGGLAEDSGTAGDGDSAAAGGAAGGPGATAAPGPQAGAEAEAGAKAGQAGGAAAAGKGPDPWEGFNRSIFRFNERVDRYALKPVAKGYKKVLPATVRKGVTNFFRNLKMPVVMLNDLLQGKPKAAGQDLSRFVVNSTVGIVGLFDPSTKFGIPQHEEDFGQTLGKWGVPPGPYLVLPFLGPSSVRDGGGFGVDVVTDPITFEFEEGVSFGLWTVKLVNTRANLLDVEEIIQGDRYLFLRDLYLQSREFAVKDGKVESDPFLDEEDPGADSSGEEGAVPGQDDGAAAPKDEAAPDAGEAPPDSAADAGAVQDNPAAPSPSVGASPADLSADE